MMNWSSVAAVILTAAITAPFAATAKENMYTIMLAESGRAWTQYPIYKKEIMADFMADLVLEKTGGAVTKSEKAAIAAPIRRCMDAIAVKMPDSTVQDIGVNCANAYLIRRRLGG